MAIEVPGGKRNLKMNINAQQAILNAYITNNSSLFKIYSAITFRSYIATSSELYNDELQGVSIYTRLSNKRLKFKCKKERIRRELGKQYVKSENEVISYCRYINNQVKFEWD